MKKLFLLALLTLTSATSFAGYSECGIGEIRAFSKNVNPNEETWIKADGRTLKIGEYAYLFSFIGLTYGGNGMDEFSIPKIDDLVLNGKKYPYYICKMGVTPDRKEGLISYISQYPDSSSYDRIEERGLVSMKRSFRIQSRLYAAYTALMPQDFIESVIVLLIPELILPEVVKNGPAKLRNYMSLNGLFPSQETLYDCEQGGVYFTFTNRAVEPNANYKEIISEKPFADVLRDGQKMNIQPRVMECLY